jgi:nicotinamide-nucleotide amidase
MAVVTATPPTAAVLAIGSELLALGRTDTNSPHIAAALQRYGIAVQFTAVVGDDPDALADALRHALARADLVVCTGGLGPTDDDRTRAAAAAVLGLVLVEDDTVLTAIRARFAARQLVMPEINRRQAEVPEGAAVVPNARGTAPGLWIPTAAGALLLLPGPPREMTPMLADALERHVAPRWGVTARRQRVVIVAGRSESWVDERLQPIYGPWAVETPPIATTILASLGIVELHVSAAGGDAAALDARLDAAVAALTAPLDADVVSVDGRGLERVVGDGLVARGWRIGVAESCTGGLITSRLTDVPGSSAYVDRSVVVYSNAAKTALLQVPPALIEAHGAVSEPVAVAMAAGMRATSGVEVAVATTGIAGPGGGTAEKPVGTVCIAVDGPLGAEVRTFRFAGDRQVVKAMASSTAIDRVRRYLRRDAPA